MAQEPHEIHRASRPRVGDPVTYHSPGRGPLTGKIHRVEGSLAWTDYGHGEPEIWAWAFRDCLNELHDWPTKEGATNGH